MINTVNIKQQQLTNTYFKTGSGPDSILIMGSCRVAPYVNYFNLWNEQNNNPFTIYTLDPFNWNWDIHDGRVDYIQALTNLETDKRILNMLSSIKIFIHEYYSNAGMFNVFKDSKNIYQYRMLPSIDICIPNFNDLFILFGDIVSFDTDIRKRAIQDYNVIGRLSEETQDDAFAKSADNLAKFYEVCKKSDIPEMGRYFLENWTTKRLFWNYNHVSKHFTLPVFDYLARKLNLDLTTEFLQQISQDDMFANNYTYLTEYDVKLHGLNWGEEIKPLKDKL